MLRQKQCVSVPGMSQARVSASVCVSDAHARATQTDRLRMVAVSIVQILPKMQFTGSRILSTECVCVCVAQDDKHAAALVLCL